MMALRIKTLFLKNTLRRSSFDRWFSNSNVLKSKKLSYSFSPGDLKLTHLTIGGILDKAVESSADCLSVVSSEQNIRKTFFELQTDVNKLASGLISLGLHKGDYIGFCAPNVYEWSVVVIAVAKAGLILVNINPAYRENELKYCLTKVPCKALLIPNKFKTQDYYKMLCSFLPELPDSKPTALNSKNIPHLKTIISLSDTAKQGTLIFADVLSAGDSKSDKALQNIEKLIQFDDPVNVQFTSGTTGIPKAAILNHHSMINNTLLGNRRMGIHTEKCITCCIVPLYHTFAMVTGLIGSVLFERALILPSSSFDAIATMDAIDKEKCSKILGAPTMYVELVNKCEQTGRSLSSLKYAVLGGAPSPDQLYKDIRDKLKIPFIFDGYGTTETSPGIALSGLSNDFSDLLGGYRPPIDFLEVKIVNKEKNLAPIGEEGEICTRGHNVFMGYYNDKAKTDEVIDGCRWYRTGDLGKMNEKGWIKVVGRIKDMVIRGGENIYPVEIENFLHSHPSLLEVYVCGVPDPKMGEELCAWVKLKAGKTLTEKDIKDFCKNKISHFKIPRYVLFVNEFPKTITGKAQKFRMTEISIKQLGL